MSLGNSSKFEFILEDEKSTQAIAKQFADLCATWFGQHSQLMVALEGNLGAGKSFFARSLIQAFLPNQKVKSPTYSLVESYALSFAQVQHFDLYRLCDPEELEYLAIRDLLTPPVLGLVEWSEKAQGLLPQFDLKIQLQPYDLPSGEVGRKIVFVTNHLEWQKKLAILSPF